MVLECAGAPPLIFDLGTGLQIFGQTQPLDGSFRATALVSHMHWDHVQGLPFFAPADRSGAELDVYAPVQEDGSLAETFANLVRPPYFPIRLEELRGDIRFHEVLSDDFSVGPAAVKARAVPHIGPTVGYRVEWDGVSVAYVSDHQQPRADHKVDPAVRELCEGVDLMIHDAQYTASEFSEKAHWGHCTVEYAVTVAQRSGARRLVMFHHDPSHDDDEMDRLVEGARCLGSTLGLTEVVAASEGLTIELGGRSEAGG